MAFALESPHKAVGLGNALVQGEVPAAWAAVWEGPEAPVTWMKAAAHRVAALGQWQQAALSGALLRAPLRLNELLSPSFFLTALRQQTARQANAADGLNC